MRRYAPVIAGLLVLSSCGGDKDSTAIESTEDGVVIEVRTSEGRARARAIYERACASCHDAGAGDAPAIGVREDWDGRSRMWVAVLTEHARLGYLEMPAKGGDQALSDAEVAAAAEYIMAVTYPELLLD